MNVENTTRSLTWVHFGDLHITDEGEENHRAFLSLIDEINTHLASHVDFCVLPGDNANNGLGLQNQPIRGALDRLRCPIHIVPGDHDRESGNLDAFYSVLRAARLPKVISLNGFRCLFLDVVSAGAGGPDFSLSSSDFQWIEAVLEEAAALAERSILFLHMYPAELRSGGRRLLDLIRYHRVLVVDMGHELSNDGHTVYAATRSTGQIEEGPVGFSIMHVEGSIVSWHFMPLHSAWPLVMLTSPADGRLKTDASQSVAGQRSVTVSARSWSANGIRACRCRWDEGPWYPMRSGRDRSRWILPFPPTQSAKALAVEVEDDAGRVGRDSIEVESVMRAPTADGSDADALGPWPKKHILGTQLGPNPNGRQW